MTKNIYIIAGISGVVLFLIVLSLQTKTEEIAIRQETNQISTAVNNEGILGLSVPLFPQSDSGQLGGVDLFELGGKVEVMIQLENVPAGVLQPAHLHLGSCDVLGKIVFSLNPVVDGSSQTILNVSGEEFQSQLPLAVNVHKSEDELGISVACGFISGE